MSIRGGRLKSQDRVWQAEVAFPRCTLLCLCAASYTTGLLIIYIYYYIRYTTKILRTYNLPPSSAVPQDSIHEAVQSPPSIAIIAFMLQSESLYPANTDSHLPFPQPRQQQFCFLSLWFLTPDVFHMSGIIQNLSFHAWLVLLSKMSCSLSLL